MEKNIFIHHIDMDRIKIQEIPKIIEDSIKEFSQDPENEGCIAYWMVSSGKSGIEYLDINRISPIYAKRIKYFFDSSQELVNYIVEQIKDHPEIDTKWKLFKLMEKSGIVKKWLVKYEQSLELNRMGCNSKNNILWKSESELDIRFGEGDSDESLQSDSTKGLVPSHFKVEIFNWFRENYSMEGLVYEKEPKNMESPIYYFGIGSFAEGEQKELFNSRINSDNGYYSDYGEAEVACIDKLIELAKNKSDANQSNR